MAEDLARLHNQFSNGDSAAREEIGGTLLPLLERRLHSRFPETDPEIVHDAVVEAIIRYLEHPALFGPAKGLALHSFVYGDAHQRFCNMVHSAHCRRARDQKWAAEQALQEEEGLEPVRTGNGPLAEERRPKVLQAWVLQAAQTEEEYRCLRLMLAGERDLCAFAKALGVTGADLAWQRRAVKQVKDRLRARLRRMWPPGGGGGIREQLDQA